MSISKPRHPCRFSAALVGVLAAAVVLLSGCEKKDNASRRVADPTGANVVIIVLDTTRVDYLSCYDYREDTTPNISRLAREGTLYDEAYSTDFWTLPSHASLFTGLYPSQVGATSETNQLVADAVTIAERLKDHGYETGAIVNNQWISRERGFAQGFDFYAEMWRPGYRDDDEHRRLTEQKSIDVAGKWLEKRLENDAPFFLFINFNVVHMPYRPTPEFRKKWVRPNRWALNRLMRLGNIAGMWGFLAGEEKFDETDFRIMRNLYEAEVAIADEQVGEIVKLLESRSILDKTLFIVTSDHGENLGEHGMIDHLFSMYETTVHIPLIIRYPERFESGAINGDLISLVDISPTVLDVCGLVDDAAPADTKLFSLCSQERLRRQFVVAENDRPINGIELMQQQYPDFDTSTIDHKWRMIRDSQYKLIWAVDKHVELYDLANDRDELLNIADTSPSIREALLADLKEWMKATETGRKPERFFSEDEETIKGLEALGYAVGRSEGKRGQAAPTTSPATAPAGD